MNLLSILASAVSPEIAIPGKVEGGWGGGVRERERERERERDIETLRH
eukprot:COSAG03_NODE_508_length_7337_cov_6.411854_2_plen_48_part_00